MGPDPLPSLVKVQPVVRVNAAFWLAGALMCVFMFASAAPSPLYAVYQQHWHFDDLTLTLVFAVYVVALLTALLLTGSLSDAVGRRPVILGATALEVAAMAVFVSATSLPWLYAARTVQGFATGTATAAISAAIVDNAPRDRPGLGPLVNSVAPTIGLALGALITAVLVQYGPAPTRLVFALLIGLLIIAATGVASRLAPASPGAGPVSVVPRVGVPVRSRRSFAAAVPALVALWALSGLYMSLGPSIAEELMGSRDLLVGGLVIFLLSGLGGVGVVAFRAAAALDAMWWGASVLLAGVVVTLAGVAARSSALFLLGTAVAGPGFGVAFLGAFRRVAAVTSLADRGRVMAAMYIVSYVAFAVPAVVAGAVASHVALRPTALGYGIGVAAVTALAVFLIARERRLSGG